MRFWLSWYQPTEDYRPLTDPPAEPVLAWWHTGLEIAGEKTTSVLCALVSADSEDHARAVVAESWPEATGFRFCDPRADEWFPATDRFPLKPWMAARMGVVEVPLNLVPLAAGSIKTTIKNDWSEDWGKD
jgi:hypothetical protein